MELERARQNLIRRIESEGVDFSWVRLPFIMYHRPLRRLVAYLDEKNIGREWTELEAAQNALSRERDD